MPVCVMWHEVLLKGSQGKARQAGRQVRFVCRWQGKKVVEDTAFAVA
jgi:hypothetical protein